MRRPFRVTAVGGFLVGWNAFVMMASLPQDLYYNNIPLGEAVVVRVASFWSVFIILGLAMLGRKNRARSGTYLSLRSSCLGISFSERYGSGW